ncbi:MAG TPA: 23S rRNA (pseudouridine(1915)-N(3))-methyltransferase RlmH [Cytophagaceae bacterium]|jgi:23S rRNA (pseudouridine1915-N3)-methyltransferase|nr:23S rRNA (pseudouridine(1915)-N(3))-methyltransferase RlmH [Cytophagaceae bacterium]
MKVLVIHNGKTEDNYLISGIEKYEKRLKHYLSIETLHLPALKNTQALSKEEQKEKEGIVILSKLQNTDFIVLLDEKGKQFTSVDFSKYLTQHMNTGTRRIVFITGGPYGFSEDVYAKANFKISLSAMTFSHQMVRLFFIEQLYRAMTIHKGEPYHHE